MKTKSFALSLFFLMLASFVYCQDREIYVHGEFAKIAKSHKMVAILPFKAVVKLRPKEMEKMTAEQMENLQRNEGLAVQSAMESYFLKRKEQHEIVIDFQSTTTTNALLSKNEIHAGNIDQYTPQELAKILEVDAVIGGLFFTDKPMSDGASLALGVLVGFYGSTNSGKCTININNGADGVLLWKYEKTLSRSLGSDTNTIINTMMRKASRQLPYIQE
ncbi:MAG: hypothetical protein IPH16_02780 [Haliscomenobacter sp.]|nr:hypothetical protein [Haliscomenobacter sp.]MBK7475293.1 hypothetical protein [Haliscomenobacter sp.]MBK8877890.1 hypothetical protein [Haliscomenobacter sp.]